MKPLAAILLGLACSIALAADVPPATRPATAPASRPASPQTADRTMQIETVLAVANNLIKQDPENVVAHQRRAESLFLLGKVDEAVKDFDKVVSLEPTSAAHNWQRGIALYYAGRYADGAKQFETHREVNPEDVENAAWHFLCLARALGPEKGPATAQEQLIPIKADTRIPLMKVHELFAGKATPEQVIETAKAGDPRGGVLNERMFYAHLYIALWHEAHGRQKEAKSHATLAATTFAEEGYMGNVARLHVWLAK